MSDMTNQLSDVRYSTYDSNIAPTSRDLRPNGARSACRATCRTRACAVCSISVTGSDFHTGPDAQKVISTNADLYCVGRPRSP